MNLLLKVVIAFLAIAYVADGVTEYECRHYPHCKSCPVNSKGKHSCVECNNMYGLDKSRDPTPCVACNESYGCHFCKTNTKCDLCIRRSLGPKPNGDGSCGPCADNCIDCGKSGAGKCNLCKEGHYLDNELCSSCLANCRKCSGSTDCVMCNRGFYKSNLLSSTTCSACIANCDLCYDSTTCDRCFPGYYAKSDKQCVSCGENCADCNQKTGKCEKCKNGKISEDGSCQCPENCRSCTKIGWGKCDDCQTGYKLTKDRLCERRD